MFKCYIFNNKIAETKHSLLCNAVKLTSQNIHSFSPAYFVFSMKILFPFQILAKFFFFFTHSILLTPLMFQTNFQIGNP